MYCTLYTLQVHVVSLSYFSFPLFQESDKLKDEDLFRLLGFMRKPAADISRRFKIIPGHLKMDIQPPYEGIPCCLTSNLFEVREGERILYLSVLSLSLSLFRLSHSLIVVLGVQSENLRSFHRKKSTRLTPLTSQTTPTRLIDYYYYFYF